jgi:hypothetical protein
MPDFNVFRETALPAAGSRLPYSLYYVAVNSTYFELYATGSTASNIRRIINQSDVENLITTALGTANGVTIVADIPARNALAPTTNIQVFVVDATGDVTVASGGATYLYNLSTTTWIKISEAESLDVILAWANIQDKPTSSVADIDNAVSLRHSHTNKTQLDKIGQNGNGNFIYDGNLPVIAWNSTAW